MRKSLSPRIITSFIFLLTATTLVAGGLFQAAKGAAPSAVAPADVAAISPELEKAILAEDWKGALKILDAKKVEELSPVERFIKGHACLAVNRNNESVACFRDSGEPKPIKEWESWTNGFAVAHNDSAVATYLHGDALARLGRQEAAIEVFSSGLKRTPNNALLLNARAVTYACVGKWNEAIVDLDDAAAARPDWAEIHNNRGTVNIRRSLGAQGAMSAFDRANKVSPEFALSRLGTAMALFGKGQWSESLAAMEKLFDDPCIGHLAAMNASVVRKAIIDSESSVLASGNAGVALEVAAREKQSQLETLNRTQLKYEVGAALSKGVGDSLRDFGTAIKTFGDSVQMVTKWSAGDRVGAMGHLGSVAERIGTNQQEIGKLQTQLAQQTNQDWNRGMADLQSLRNSGLKGGVSTEELRRGMVDKGNWGFLARFAYQYPEAETPATGPVTRPAN
jgi:hypothetical protein